MTAIFSAGAIAQIRRTAKLFRDELSADLEVIAAIDTGLACPLRRRRYERATDRAKALLAGYEPDQT
jgi:hypothetical protein